MDLPMCTCLLLSGYLLTLFDANGNHLLDLQELISLLDNVFAFLEHIRFARLHIDRTAHTTPQGREWTKPKQAPFVMIESELP